MKKLNLPTSLTLKRASVLTMSQDRRSGWMEGGGIKALFTHTYTIRLRKTYVGVGCRSANVHC